MKQFLTRLVLLAGMMGAAITGMGSSTARAQTGDNLLNWFPSSISILVQQGFYQPAFEKLSEVARNGPTKLARANAKAQLSLFYFHGIGRPVEPQAGLALLKQAIAEGEANMAWDVLGEVWAKGWMGPVDYLMAGFAWQAAADGKNGRKGALEKRALLHDRLEMIVQDRGQPFFQLEQLLKAGRQADVMARLDEVITTPPRRLYERNSLRNPVIREAVAAYWLWSRLDEIWPPAILHFLVPRYTALDPQMGMRLYALALLRSSYDAKRCREEWATAVFGNNLPAASLATAQMINAFEARQAVADALEWAIERDDAGDNSYNQAWICRYASDLASRGPRAYWTALKPLNTELQRDKATWTMIRQDVIATMRAALKAGL